LCKSHIQIVVLLRHGDSALAVSAVIMHFLVHIVFLWVFAPT
jgi:hypothetical protein